MQSLIKRSCLDPEGLGQLAFLVIAGILLAGLPFFEAKIQEAEADVIRPPKTYTPKQNFLTETLLISQNNSLFPFQNPHFIEPRVIKKIQVVVTAYSSSPFETDDSPYVTAAGTLVREGIVANNLLPFGSKIRLPEIYGEKIFLVEDRMHWLKGPYYVDIWFPSHWEALNFGAKRTFIEVIEG